MITEAEGERDFRRCYSSSFEDKGWDHKPKNADSLYKLEKAMKLVLP